MVSQHTRVATLGGDVDVTTLLTTLTANTMGIGSYYRVLILSKTIAYALSSFEEGNGIIIRMSNRKNMASGDS